jgi:hypothetical protein
MTIFALAVAVSIIGVVGVLIVSLGKILNARHVLYSTWASFAFLAFIALLLGGFMYTTSVATMELCDSIELVLEDPKYYKYWAGILHTESLQSCLYGDGDLLTYFNLKSDLQYINEVSSDLKNIDSIKDLYKKDVNFRNVDIWLAEID